MEEYINGFVSNLGNQYTIVLLGFILGYTVSQKVMFGSKSLSVLFRIACGIAVAILLALMASFIENVLPATIPLNIKAIFVVAIIVALLVYL